MAVDHRVPRQARLQSQEDDGLGPAEEISMTNMSRRAFGAFVTCALASGGAVQAFAQDLENTLSMDLSYGRVVIQLRPDVAPKTVARIKELARQGFYDGTPFHRVIPNFMAQGGDPTGTGTGGSGKRLEAEFSAVKHVRGT